MNIGTVVLYHRDADGFGAAYALWKAGFKHADFISVQYGEQIPDIPMDTHQLFIVDFSYDRQTLIKLHNQYKVLVLDHHKTAEADLKGLEFACFNTYKSGAGLTWDHFHEEPLPPILKYVQDRDLWRFSLPYSEEVNLYIGSLPWDFEVWDKFDLEMAVAAGKAIKAFQDAQIRNALRNVRFLYWQIKGEVCEIPVVNISENISEVGNALCQEYPNAPFSASYCDRDKCRTWSLRSIGDFDVSTVAREHGGGGHKNAAGFTAETGWPQVQHGEFQEAFNDDLK